MSQNSSSQPDDRSQMVVSPFLILENQPSATGKLVFSPDGTILASCGWDTRFWYEDTQANWKLHHTSPAMLLSISSHQTFEMAFFQDGYMDRIELQDREGRCLQTRSCRHIPQKYLVGYSPDLVWLLTCDEEGWMYFWDAKTLRFATRQLLVPMNMRVLHPGPFRLTSDGRYLFFLYRGRLYRCQFSSYPPQVLPEGDLFEYPPGHFSAEYFTISPKGECVAVANADPYLSETIRGVDLYETTSLRLISRLPAGDVYVLDFSPDGNYLVSVDVESCVSLWNIVTRHLEQTFISHPGPMMEQSSAIASVAWSPRGDLIATEGSLEEIRDYRIKLWKVEYL